MVTLDSLKWQTLDRSTWHYFELGSGGYLLWRLLLPSLEMPVGPSTMVSAAAERSSNSHHQPPSIEASKGPMATVDFHDCRILNRPRPGLPLGLLDLRVGASTLSPLLTYAWCLALIRQDQLSMLSLLLASRSLRSTSHASIELAFPRVRR